MTLFTVECCMDPHKSCILLLVPHHILRPHPDNLTPLPFFKSESRNEIYSLQISGGGRVWGGGAAGGIAWPPLISSEGLPHSHPPLSFIHAKHLSAGTKYEFKDRKRVGRFGCTQCLLSPARFSVLISPVLSAFHHICQHQFLQQNYRLRVAQNGDNDDYNQTRDLQSRGV